MSRYLAINTQKRLALIKDQLIAHDVGEMRIGEATAVKAETILALCPCCEFQLRVTKEKKNSPVEIRDLAAFACQGLGKTFADPSDEVSRQWKVFEGMIALMTPQGFANLMGTMWPEMLKAMLLGMGGMMKFMGKLGPFGGFMFALMKPMFPILFPKLLPGMMPKVMPAMLERVGAMIPMPDYMKDTDAGHDAQGHGQPDAPYAAGRRAPRRAEDDRLSAWPGLSRIKSGGNLS